MLIVVCYFKKICGINQAEDRVTWPDLLLRHTSALASFRKWLVVSAWLRIRAQPWNRCHSASPPPSPLIQLRSRPENVHLRKVDFHLHIFKPCQDNTKWHFFYVKSYFNQPHCHDCICIPLSTNQLPLSTSLPWSWTSWKWRILGRISIAPIRQDVAFQLFL